ncbi:MAG: diguanylate cyclase [Planctomycetes bacterium]|nr:diguanylate cyclase [Planctomycetota bacterium]
MTSGQPPHIFLLLHRAATVEPHSGFGPEELARVLERAKYEVTLSRTPRDTIEILEGARPSVIVLDPLVTAADGIEFEMIARHQDAEDPTPVLFLVDSMDELVEIRKVDALFKDFLVRPFRTEELEHRIEAALWDKRRFLEMRSHARRLESEVIRDFKTGLYTERHFRHLLSQEFQRAERHRAPLSFLLIDIDDFKSINDGCDYAFGDYVLTEFAQILLASIREIDHAARFGGDEFMILLPSTAAAEAVHVAGRIRSTLERRTFDDGNFRIQVTTSIGIDTFDGRGLSSPRDLRRRANLALKEAKSRGKNRIWLYSGARENPRGTDLPPPESGPSDTPDDDMPGDNTAQRSATSE